MSGGGTRSGRRRTGGAVDSSAAYKEFDEVATSSFSFDGEDTATADWFEKNSNFSEICNTITEDDRSALVGYTSGDFMRGELYYGFSKMDNYKQSVCKKLDNILDKSVINSNIKVARLSTAEFLLGKDKIKGTLEELQATKGKTITAKSFLSTCAAKEGLEIGNNTKQVEYKIHIPKGSKGAGMYIGGKKLNLLAMYQREFLVNRDTQWKVGDTKWNAKRKIFETDLFFEDLLPHDYS